jgi:hypothetical protein
LPGRAIHIKNARRVIIRNNFLGELAPTAPKDAKKLVVG